MRFCPQVMKPITQHDDYPRLLIQPTTRLFPLWVKPIKRQLSGNPCYVCDAQGGVEELVFAVPEGTTKSASAYTGSGGGIFGDCCGGGGGGGGEYADSVDDDGGGGAGGMLGDSDDEEDYNCLHGGILSGILPEASRTCCRCCWLHGRTATGSVFCRVFSLPFPNTEH